MMGQSFLRKLYDYFIRNWFLSAIISAAPTFGFALIEIFGHNFGWVTGEGMVTRSALRILVPFFVISLLFSFIMAAATNYDEKTKRNGQYVSSRIIQGLDAIKHSKLRRFIDYIEANRGKTGISPFHEITQPRKQLESILEHLQITLADIFGLRRDEISLSVIYRTDKNPKWDWLYTFNLAHDFTVDELVGNPRTGTRQIIDGKTTSLFYADKRRAIANDQYVPGQKDSAYRNIGSIICRDISVDDNNCVEAILGISTFGHQLCLENDEDAKFKIQTILLPSFERRIQLELSLLYIKDVMAA